MDMADAPEVTEALAEPFDPEKAAQQPLVIEIPPQVMIDTLRGEIANLNDQRLNLQTQVNWLSTMVQVMKAQIDGVVPHVHEDGTEHVG